jgi:hypothetical protein
LNIEAFIGDEMRRPCDPGSCCRIADRWFTTVKGYSALERYGRDFSTDADVEAWLAEPGGIAVAVNRVMRACGIRKTATPQAGDLGLVVWSDRVFMAVFTGHGWFSRDVAGLIMAPSSAVRKAWSLA